MDEKPVTNPRDVVQELLDKALDAYNPVTAMNWAQAACNAANALRAKAVMEEVKSDITRGK